MTNKRRAMYDRFSDTSKHSAEGVRVKEFLKLDFASGHREASCSCSMCENRRILSKYEMSAHLAKKGAMLNYHLWHQHGEVQLAVADESDGNDDVDRMDDMVADIGRRYDLESEDRLTEVQNFYRLLAAIKEKVHDGTDVIVLQAVIRLMGFKSKYIFSNKCYNDIVKLIIDLIPVNHNMSKDLYQSKKIGSGLGLDYEKIDACEKNCMLFWKEHKDDIKCMHCGKFIYVKVIIEDGTSNTIKVVVKQLYYIPIMPRLNACSCAKK
jgi:hypothetical protein